ncbi:unnamed protein product [Trifolium pratense]|uniref:Uncharacterized protein n=1 Tax=Trifolium pratense TaxID=57577 RepID=A0ACB0L9H6_TRIPR|nr:unnamed protein product [Trifolium pratense]
MEAYLEANDLWEAVEDEYEIDPLPDNPTVAQIKIHKTKKQRKSKAKSYLFSAVSEAIFTRIMTLKSAKAIWDFLKQEYEGNEKIKGMQVLNLIREFEMQRMKESETIKEYSDKLLSIVNNVRLLGTEFSDTRIVQKILVTVPERFESTISSLENSKDLSTITLSELVYALQAQEQRRLMREEGTIEGALQAKLKLNQGHKGEKKKAQWNNYQKGEGANKLSSKAEDEQTNYPPCQHCEKTNHPHFRCWSRPNFRCNKCNQPGHIAKFCKNEVQPKVEAQVADQNEEEEYLFAATCLSTDKNKKNWLVDSGCTHHMAHDEELFKKLDKTIVSKVTIGNGQSVDVKGKGVVAVETLSGTKYISDVLFVPELNQNLLSVGQMLEKHYTLHFNDMKCTIFDPVGGELMSIKMRNRSFPIEWKQTAMHASPSVVEASNKEKNRVEILQGQNSKTAEEKFDDNANFSVKKCEPHAEIFEMCNVAMVNPLGDANVASMDGWRVVLQEDKNMKEKNESWQFEDKPRDQKLNNVKWVYRTKLDHNGSKNKFQEKLVDKGFREHEVYFSNDFAHVASHEGASFEAEKIYKVH